MGKVFNNKIQGMSWWTKASLVLLLTLTATIFMYEGWYLPRVSNAATATYYAKFDSTTNLGIDGTANLLTGAPSSYTGYPSKAQMGTTELGTAGRHYPTGMAQGVATVIERWYAPAYTTNAQDISNISASFALRPVNSSDTFQLNVYDYNPAGAAGNKTLVATGTTKTAISSGTTSQYAWTTGNFTISGTGRVALNHRLLVELVYTQGGSTTGVRVYYGVAGTTTSSNITVTETPVASGDTLTASANTAIATSPQLTTATNVLMQRFQVAASANTIELNSLTLNDLGTATLIDNAKIYIDTVSQATLPGTAVLIGNQAAWGGTSTAIPLNQGTTTNRTVTSGTPKYIYVIFDMNSTMATRTVQSQVTALGVVTPDTGASGLTYNSNAITLSAAAVDTLTAGTNTAIATSASDSSPGVIMQRLKLDSNANGDSQVILSGITLDEAGTATSIANVKLYIDTVAQSTLSASAVLIGNLASWNGASTTVTLNQGTAANRTVTAGTSKYLYVVFDMASGQSAKTVQSHVTAVSVASPDTGAAGLSYSSNLFTLTTGPVSTITSCTGCHGNPPVDGTARNVPAGQFQGSHNLHSATCTVCHVDNGTNLKHADGNINMAVPVNNTGGAYSKGASFAVSNAAFVGGTCSGTYCHGQGAPTWGASSAAPVNGYPYSSVQCAKCHSGNLATDVTTANPFYSTAIPKVTLNTNAKVGAHTNHMTSQTLGISVSTACTDCHGTVTLTAATHMTGSTTFAWSALATKSGALAPAYTAATGSCANVYCHGASMPGGDTTGTNRAPTWINPNYLPATISAAACGICHGFPPATASGHPSVTVPAGFPATATIGTTCSCHTNINTAGNSYANIFVNPALHINGILETPLGGHSFPYSGSTHLSAAGATPWASCTSCHTNTTGGTYPVAAGTAPNCTGCHINGLRAPSGTSSCWDCHGASATDGLPNGTTFPNIAGSHALHAAITGTTCTTCHTGGGTGTATHGSSNRVAATAASVKVAFTGQGTSPLWTLASKTCSATNCHGQGAPTWGATSTAPVSGFPYSSVQCAKCHSGNLATDVTAAKPFYSTAIPQVTLNTNAKVGAHTSHVAAIDTLANNLVCADCHGTVTLTAATHMNGTTNFVWSTLATKSGALAPTYTATTGVCANVYCHGASMPGGDTTGTNKAPTWNSSTYLPATLTAAGCGTCHGFPPSTASGHPAVTIPAGFPTTATIGTTCSCHTNINTAGNSYANIFVNKALHIDGILQVSGGHAVPYDTHKADVVAAGGNTACLGCHAMGTATSPYPAAVVGNPPDCMSCHQKAAPVHTGTVAGANCSSCHGLSTATTTKIGRPVGTAYPDRLGYHSGASDSAHGTAACTVCHSGAGTTSGNNSGINHGKGSTAGPVRNGKPNVVGPMVNGITPTNSAKGVGIPANGTTCNHGTISSGCSGGGTQTNRW